MNAEQVMLERRSVRKYETGHEIPQDVLNEILALAHSAPSSWNLQHWHFLVVTDQARKERLLPMAYGQQQTAEASALVFLLADLEWNKKAEPVYTQAVKSGTPENVKDMMIQQIEGAYQGNPAYRRDEALLNAGFAGMQFMLAAKAKGYDTCPMGGIDRDAIRQELNVPERYHIAMLMTLGKAAAEGRPTERLPLEDVVTRETF